MRVGSTSRTFPEGHSTVFNRANVESGWNNRRPISYADDTEAKELQIALRGWKEAEPTTIRVEDAVAEHADERVVAIVDDLD